MELKQSPFLHVLSVDDNHCAFYHSLSMEVAFLRKEFVEGHRRDGVFFSSDGASEKVLASLQEMGFLIGDGVDGYELYREYQKVLEEPAINILYLLLTDMCNIRCRYCYFLSPMPQDYKPSLMKKETAIEALNFFAHCAKRSIAKGHPDQHIVLYGGEPTINKTVLVASLKHIRVLCESGDLPKDIPVTLNTNGILLDEEILAECRKTNAIVAISIDGPKEVHDEMRVDHCGGGTFDRVISAYQQAKDSGARTGICVTIDQHNVSRMEEIVQWLFSEFGVKGLGFNILIENSLCANSFGKEKPYADIVAQGLIGSFKAARKLGVYEDRMMRRVSNFLDKTPVFSDCGGCGLQVVISPDGQVGVCQAFCGEKKYFTTERLDTFEPESHPYWKLWRKRSPLTNSECKDCIALGNCGGGCPYSAYCSKGDINALDERFCAHAKTATLFLINDLWEQTTT